MNDALDRIIDEAEKALTDEPVESLKDLPLGVYGLSHRDIRLGNIIAIAKIARLKGGEQDASLQGVPA